jgi:hypothetical protein
VAITAAAGASGTAVFTFTFSEDVGNSFVAEDIAVTGGTAGSLVKVDATHYTMTVTGSNGDAGTIAVSVAATKFKDVALNDNVVVAEASHALGATTVATFDETVAPAFVGFNGAEATSISAGPAGGSGNALKIVRNGGDPWAGAKLTGMTLGITTTNNTFSARVYSPLAGKPMVLKLEGNGDTGDIQANETVVAGWQTLTWTVPSAKIGPVRSVVVFLPNLGTVGTGEIYYVDDVKLLGTGTSQPQTPTPTPNPTAAAGSAGPVTIPVLTAADTMGFAGVGDAVFAGDYIGGLDSNNKRAKWDSATTNGVASNGNIGYFQDTALSTSAQKLEENGWVAGLPLLHPKDASLRLHQFLHGAIRQCAKQWHGGC